MFNVDTIKEKIDTIGTGILGTGTLEAIHHQSFGDIVTAAMQFLVSAFTLWALIGRKKNKDK